jgi:2-C-methyl-D-erythritol 4-phosphate cytidylyltransferase
MSKISFSVILLAGGKGTRMKSDTPKQFLLLQNKPLARYSFDLFTSIPGVVELVVVCDPLYQNLFSQTRARIQPKFALPGVRRQDSVLNGLRALSNPENLVCIHDSARPFLTAEIVERVVGAAHKTGAATTGMPIKYTVKTCDKTNRVLDTPDRSRLWEIQTPQVVRSSLLLQGFEKVERESLTVTDDVSLVELLGQPVEVVEGNYANLKITTPEDMTYAHYLVKGSSKKKSSV